MLQVQDTLDPQYYIGAFQRPDGSWRTTKYMDSLAEPIEAGAKQSIWERRPVYCVAVPGLSAWAATDMERASTGPANLSTTSAGMIAHNISPSQARWKRKGIFIYISLLKWQSS